MIQEIQLEESRADYPHPSANHDLVLMSLSQDRLEHSFVCRRCDMVPGHEPGRYEMQFWRLEIIV